MIKKLLIVFTVMLANVAISQDCITDDCSVVFDFMCAPDPFNLTDEQIRNTEDRDALIQALVGTTAASGAIITKIDYEPTNLKFITRTYKANGNFTTHAGGSITVLDDIHSDHFLSFYRSISQYIQLYF